MPSTNSIPPDANSNITLSTLVEALADDFEIGKTSEYFPTSGRVVKDSEDGTIYLADGTSWNDVSSAIGIDSPRTQTDQATVTTFDTKIGNEVRYTSQFSGGDIGARVQAAHDDLPSSGGVINIDEGGAWDSQFNPTKGGIRVAGLGIGGPTINLNIDNAVLIDTNLNDFQWEYLNIDARTDNTFLRVTDGGRHILEHIWMQNGYIEYENADVNFIRASNIFIQGGGNNKGGLRFLNNVGAVSVSEAHLFGMGSDTAIVSDGGNNLFSDIHINNADIGIELNETSAATMNKINGITTEFNGTADVIKYGGARCVVEAGNFNTDFDMRGGRVEFIGCGGTLTVKGGNAYVVDDTDLSITKSGGHVAHRPTHFGTAPGDAEQTLLGQTLLGPQLDQNYKNLESSASGSWTPVGTPCQTTDPDGDGSDEWLFRTSSGTVSTIQDGRWGDKSIRFQETVADGGRMDPKFGGDLNFDLTPWSSLVMDLKANQVASTTFKLFFNDDTGGNQLIRDLQPDLVAGEWVRLYVSLEGLTRGSVNNMFVNIDNSTGASVDYDIRFGAIHVGQRADLIGRELHGVDKITAGGTIDLDGNDLNSVGDVDINPTNTYSPSNDTTDRTFDADNTTTAELADVVATIIRDLGLDA